MYSSFKINHVRIILIRHIFDDRIGKYMQIIQAISIKLDRQLLWFIYRKQLLADANDLEFQ